MTNPNSNRLLNLMLPLLLTVWSFMLISIVCESGERVTEQFSKYNDTLNQCNWYLLPVDIQQMLLIFIADVQQPIHIRGYGNIICTRDSFKQVTISTSRKNKTDKIIINLFACFQTIHRGFSYFMLLRQINA